MDKLPTVSTGDRRISEPSTISHDATVTIPVAGTQAKKKVKN